MPTDAERDVQAQTLRQSLTLEHQQPASAVRATEPWIAWQRTADALIYAQWVSNRISRQRGR
jgi:hypothetical protein